MYTRNVSLILLIALASFNSILAYPFEALAARADDSSTAKSEVTKTSAAPSSVATTTAPKETGSDSDGSSKGSKTTAAPTSGPTGTRTSKVTTSVIDPRLAPGMVVLQTPVTTATQYFKMGDYVTFGWNYTNLLTKPTVKVQAYCAQNNLYFDIASNLTESQTTVVWNTTATKQDQSKPFDEAMYNLVIFDQSQPSQVSATPAAGRLQPFTTFKFGIYAKTVYKPLSQYQCPTCDNSTASAINTHVMHFTLGASLISAFSFLYFVNGAI